MTGHELVVFVLAGAIVIAALWRAGRSATRPPQTHPCVVCERSIPLAELAAHEATHDHREFMELQAWMDQQVALLDDDALDQERDRRIRFMAHPMADDRRRERRSLVIQTVAFLWLFALVVIAFPLLAP